MRIEQLRESQTNTLNTLRKNSVLKVYIPIVGASQGVKAATNGISSNDLYTSDGVKKTAFPVSLDQAFAYHAGDIVITVLTTPAHLRPPKKLKNKESVAKAESMYPESHYPLLSYSLGNGKQTALLDGTIAPSNIQEIVITGYDAAGNKTKRGIDVLPTSRKQLITWYVNSYQRNKKEGGHEINPPKSASPYYTPTPSLGNRDRVSQDKPSKETHGLHM